MNAQPVQTSQLKNLNVLITRPSEQSEELSNSICQHGGIARKFPTLIISPCNKNKELITVIKDLQQVDIAIFVSSNAVRFSAPYIRECWPQLPTGLKLAAVGSATAQAIARQGWQVEFCPTEQFSSEGLLEIMPQQAVADKNIVIFCGENPKQTLVNGLRQQGAQIKVAYCYQRECPQVEVGPLLALWKQGRIDVVTSTSSESLLNLFTLLGKQGEKWLMQTPLLVISEAMERVARELGYCAELILAKNATNEAIVAALIEWYKGKSDG